METLPSLYRVCLIGPECTGKSTLAAELAAHFETVWVPEFAREYAERVKRHLTFDDVDPIGRGQVANEERALPNANGLLILDTDLISTDVYSSYYYGDVPGWIPPEAFRRRANLYLLFDIDVPFAADAVRDDESDRRRHFDDFRTALADYGVEHAIVGGDWEARRARVFELVRRAYAAR